MHCVDAHWVFKCLGLLLRFRTVLCWWCKFTDANQFSTKNSRIFTAVVLQPNWVYSIGPWCRRRLTSLRKLSLPHFRLLRPRFRLLKNVVLISSFWRLQLRSHKCILRWVDPYYMNNFLHFWNATAYCVKCTCVNAALTQMHIVSPVWPDWAIF